MQTLYIIVNIVNCGSVSYNDLVNKIFFILGFLILTIWCQIGPKSGAEVTLFDHQHNESSSATCQVGHTRTDPIYGNTIQRIIKLEGMHIL